jgi:hypothetical protein
MLAPGIAGSVSTRASKHRCAELKPKHGQAAPDAQHGHGSPELPLRRRDFASRVRSRDRFMHARQLRKLFDGNAGYRLRPLFRTGRLIERLHHPAP